jgi:hypothetical protein
VNASAGRESNAVVFLTGLGLATMAALVAYLASLGGEVEDGATLLAESFTVETWPFDLHITGAATLPLGERVLRLQREGESSQPLPDPAADDVPIVWTALPVGPPDQFPREAALVWFPENMAAAALQTAFGDLPSTPPEELEDQGGSVVVRSERVPWGKLETPLVHERRYGPGRVFHDSVRVNISTGANTCILYVTWDAGLPGSVALALQVLESIRPR